MSAWHVDGVEPTKTQLQLTAEASTDPFVSKGKAVPDQALLTVSPLQLPCSRKEHCPEPF